MRRLSLQAGFTLIEIMVVVFILGLLVTLVAPKVIGKTDKARQVAARVEIKAIEEACNLFRLDNGFYPATLDGLVVPPPGARNFEPDGYLPRVPGDPWGNAYVYRTDGRNIYIKSLGADAQDGGDGYDADIDNIQEY